MVISHLNYGRKAEDQKARENQIKKALKSIENEAAVIAGDLNTSTKGPSFKKRSGMGSTYKNAFEDFEKNSGKPFIDGALYDPTKVSITCTEAEEPKWKGHLVSDHPYLLFTVERKA